MTPPVLLDQDAAELVTLEVAVLVPSLELTQNDNTTQQQEPQPTAIAHEQKWYQDDAGIKLPIKSNYSYWSWAVKARNGECIGKGGNPQQTHSHLESLLMLVPSSQLNLIVNLTNGDLAKT